MNGELAPVVWTVPRGFQVDFCRGLPELRQNRRRRSCGYRRFLLAEVSLVGRTAVKRRMWAALIVEQGLRAPTGSLAGKFYIGFSSMVRARGFRPRRR